LKTDHPFQDLRPRGAADILEQRKGQNDMGQRVAGKLALVTSAAQGIGRSSALALVAEGARVIATDINDVALATLKKEHPEIDVMRLDVTSNEDVARVAAAVGTPDALFNCSGYVHNGTILDVDDKAWDFSFDINVRAHYRLMKAFTPGWLAKGKASVINMSSIASSLKGVPNRFLYGATKAAVIGMTKAMAADFVSKGIRVNAICPGTVDTPSLHERMKASGNYEEARKAFIARQPMGRLAQPEEIAALVVYLASDESGFTTGQTFTIDGGWST
jgi:2-keto-3-deoxy-L-fuconate dehydrogenase